MGTIAIGCESGCDVPASFCDELGIVIVPLTIRFGNDEFSDRVSITKDEFWQRCASSPTLPETAAPSPGSYVAAFTEAISQGAAGIVVLCISGDLSASYQSATVAASMIDTVPITVIDTRAVSMGQGLLAVQATEEARDGASLDAIVAHVRASIPKVGIIAVLDTLDHLIKGGRIGGARALIGQVLAIKPVLRLNDGRVDEAGRERTTTKALRRLANEAGGHGQLSRLALFHADSPHVETLITMVSDIPVTHSLIVADIGPTIGTHGGPGVIGLAWLEA
jgi:DegV family protein with EDD domain